jgi:hypothetical protein
MDRRGYMICKMSAGNQEFDAKFFDTASAAWMINKKKLGNCTYVYKCTYKHANGKTCDKAATIQPLVRQDSTMKCWAHRGSMKKKEL